MAKQLFLLEEVRFMTIDEFTLYYETIPLVKESFWLMDKAYGEDIAFVAHPDGVYDGTFISNKNHIRLVLVTLESSDEIGSTVNLHGVTWYKFNEQKINKKITKHFYVSVDCVASQEPVVFDKNTNIYEDSFNNDAMYDFLGIKKETNETEKERKKRLKQEEKERKKKEKELEKIRKKREKEDAAILKKELAKEKALEKKAKKQVDEDDDY